MYAKLLGSTCTPRLLLEAPDVDVHVSFDDGVHCQLKCKQNLFWSCPLPLAAEWWRASRCEEHAVQWAARWGAPVGTPMRAFAPVRETWTSRRVMTLTASGALATAAKGDQ
jgi:hypothetical protein